MRPTIDATGGRHSAAAARLGCSQECEKRGNAGERCELGWLGYGDSIYVGAGSGRLAEVSAPYVVVAVVDDAVAIAVGGKPIAYLTKGFAPDDVIRRIDGTVVVVVARYRHD